MTEAELRALRASLLTEAQGLLTRSEGADLTGPDADRFDAITAELDGITAKIDRHVMVARMVADGRALVESGDGATGAPALITRSNPWTRSTSTPAETRDAALAAIDASPAPDAAKVTADALVRTSPLAAQWARATSDPGYLAAFHKVWRDPTLGHLEWSDDERRAHAEVATLQRAMGSAGSAGGYMVPFELDPAITLSSAGSVNPIRQVARVEQIVTGTWHGVSSAGVTASWDGEAAEVSDDAPTLAQPTVTAWKGEAFIPFAIEVGMDASDFANQCAGLLTDAKDQLEAAAFITGLGDGSHQPTGLVTALDGTASEVAPTTPETFAVADVYKLQEALPARFRAGARWMMALETVNRIRQFATGTGPQHAMLAELGDGVPAQLLGWPLHENSSMDGTFDAAATADNFIAIVGDFANYLIADRVGTTVELVPHLLGGNGRPTGQRGYYMYFRTGADVLVDNAFRVLNIATTA